MIEIENMGNGLKRTYSNSGLKIRKIGTEEIYVEAIDVIDSIFQYEETNELVEETRTYSKYKLLVLLMEANRWNDVKSILVSRNLMDLWNAALEFTSDDHYFNIGIDLIKEELGLSDETVNSILSRCLKD